MTSQTPHSHDQDPAEGRYQLRGSQDMPDYSHLCLPSFQSSSYSRAPAFLAPPTLADPRPDRHDTRYEVPAPALVLAHQDPFGAQLGLSPSDVWEITNSKYSLPDSQSSLPPVPYYVRPQRSAASSNPSNVPTPSRRSSAEGLIPLLGYRPLTPTWSSVFGETQIFHRY